MHEGKVNSLHSIDDLGHQGKFSGDPVEKASMMSEIMDPLYYSRFLLMRNNMFPYYLR